MIVELNAVNVPLGWISIKHLPNEVSAKVCDAICILLCVSLWSKFINNVVFCLLCGGFTYGTTKV